MSLRIELLTEGQQVLQANAPVGPEPVVGYETLVQKAYEIRSGNVEQIRSFLCCQRLLDSAPSCVDDFDGVLMAEGR